MASSLAEFRLRLLSAGILVPVVLLVVWWGTPGFEILIGFGAAVSMLEWRRMTGAPLGNHPWLVAALVAVVAAMAGVIVTACAGQTWRIAGLLMVLLVLVWAMGAGRGRPDRDQSLWGLLGVLYLAGAAAILIDIRQGVEGLGAIVWLLVVVWATDTGAYGVGRLIGGPKLVPRISPAKTWSGALGGVAVGALAGGLVAWAGGMTSPWSLAAGAVAVSLACQGGDLLESAIKRGSGTKDSGGWIPGHGGLLDRIDGLLTAAPVAAVVLRLTAGP